MSKKITMISVIVVILIVLTVAIVTSVNNEKFIREEVSEDEMNFKNDYENLNSQTTADGKQYPKVKLPADNKIKYTTVSEILNIMDNKQNAVIYFGESTCLYCRSAVQVLLDAALGTKLDKIYYLQHDEVEYDEKYNLLMQKMGDYYTTTNEKTNVKKITIPLVIFVADGRIMSSNIGTLTTHNDPYSELEKDQVAGLKEIYTYGIKDVLNENY